MKQQTSEITSKTQQQQQSEQANKQITDDSGKAVVNTSEANFIYKVIKETRKDFIYEQSLVDCALIFSKLRAFQQVYSAKGLASIAQFLKKCSIIEISQANKVFYEREKRSDECSAFLLLRGAIKIEEFAPSNPLDISKISTQQPGNDANKEINNAQQVLIKKSKVVRQSTTVAHSKNESSKEKDQTEKQPSSEIKESISAEQNVFTINEMELFGQRKREGRPILQKCIALSEQCILLSFELSSLESLFAVDEVAVSTVREKKNILNDLPLFSQCSFKQITSLSLMATTFTLLKGEKLFSQDDFSKGFFYLLQGELEVVLDSGTASQLKVRESSLNESELLRKNSGKSRLLNLYSEQHCKQVGILTACDVVGLEDLVLERPRPVRIQVLSYEATLLYFPLQSFEIQTFLNDQTKNSIASTDASQVAWRQTRAKINSNTLTRCQFYNQFVQSPKISKRHDNSSFDALNASASRRKTEQSFFETPSKDKQHQRHSPICNSKEKNQHLSDRESLPQYSPLNRTSYKYCNTPNETRKRNQSGEGLKFERLKDANRTAINSSASNKKEQNNLQDAIRKEQPASLNDRRNGWFNMNDSIMQQKIGSFVDFPEGSSLQQIPLLNESQDILNLSSSYGKRQFIQSKNSASPISDFISKTQGSQRKKSSKPNKITLPVFRLEKILKERENNGQEQYQILEINDPQIFYTKHSPNNHPTKSQEERNNYPFKVELSHINTFSGEEDELKQKNHSSAMIEKDSVSTSSPNQQKSGLQVQKDNPEDSRSQSDNTKNDRESSKGDKEALRNVTQQSEEENRIIEADETIRQKLEIKKRVLERFAEIPKGENDNQERYIYPRNLFDRKKDLNIRIQLEKCRLEEQQRSTSLYLHNTRYEHSGYASFILFEDYKNRKIRYFKRDKNLLGIADTSQGTSQTNGSALIPPLVVERSAAVKNNKRKLKNSRNTECGNFLNKSIQPKQTQGPFRWQE